MNDYKLTEGSSVLLDLIRGLSAQVVVIGHAISLFGVFTFLHEPNFPWMQYIAVLIFFILSGFLIPYSTVRRQQKSSSYGFNNFLADRFSRIYATFVPAILFVLIIDLISIQIDADAYGYYSSLDLKTLIGNLFMLQEYPPVSVFKIISAPPLGSGRPFWTLAIEWWIYLAYGYLVLVILRKSRLNLLNVVVLCFLSIVPAYHLILGHSNGLTTYWLFGAVAYLVTTMELLAKISSLKKVLFSLVFFTVGMLRAYLLTDGFDPIFAFFLAVTLWLLLDIFRTVQFSELAVRFIRYIASYSYTLYLTHYSILYFLQSHYGAKVNPIVLLVGGFLVANAVSIAIGRYTERKLTRRIKEWLYSKIEQRTT